MLYFSLFLSLHVWMCHLYCQGFLPLGGGRAGGVPGAGDSGAWGRKIGVRIIAKKVTRSMRRKEWPHRAIFINWQGIIKKNARHYKKWTYLSSKSHSQQTGRITRMGGITGWRCGWNMFLVLIVLRIVVSRFVVHIVWNARWWSANRTR